MKRVIIDANTILGHLVRNEVTLEFGLREYDELIIPTVVVFEVVYVLEKQYELERLEIFEALLKILQNRKVQSERVLLLNSLIKYRDLHSLSLVDSYLVELSGELDCGVLTEDRKMRKKVK